MRRIIAAFAIAAFCTPALGADPLTLLLLRIVRDKIISTGIEIAVERSGAVARAPPPAPSLSGLPYAGFNDAQLRRLIDEGFVHLTSAQRDEVYASVRGIVADPKNAADVPAIIADLAIKASAVRQAHEQLTSLSFARKRLIAAEARDEYERMPPETREQMASVLRQRLVPLPVDLTEMILAEFDRARSHPVHTPPVAAADPVAAPALPVSDTTTAPAKTNSN